MLRTTHRSVGGATLIALMLTFVLSIPAVAAIGDYVADGVNIRSGPDYSYTVLGLGYIGQGACVYYDTYTNGVRWRYHTNLMTSVTGYSYGPYVEVTDWYTGC